MAIFVEWYPEHVRKDPEEAAANQAWAEMCYIMLREGGVVGTDVGVYVKRDGGLYQLKGTN